jgi:AraC-like DNA-binding protein
MYFTKLPDHKAIGFDEQLHFSRFKKHNVIFNAISDQSYCERHIGCLSIKTVTSGEEWYTIDKRSIAVRPGQFLMLNDEQEYSSRIESKARTLSIFFREDFAAAVLRNALYDEDTLLDNPFESGKVPTFFQTLSYIDDRLKQHLHDLVSSLNDLAYDSQRVDESLTFILHDLLSAQNKHIRCAAGVKACKPATRMEIYRRLCIAKDLMHSTFMYGTDLASMSSVACLSTPQLIRQFKAAFNITPHQYLTQIRLLHAVQLLKHANTSIEEITLACGFEDSSAFCRLFKKVYGVSPGQYRN